MKKTVYLLTSVIAVLVIIAGVILLTKSNTIEDNALTKTYQTKEMMGDYHSWDNIDVLINNSDLILIGEVKGDFADAEQTINYGEFPDGEKYPRDYYTTREVKVHKWIKGHEEHITLAEPAALIKDKGSQMLIIYENYPIAKNGVKYLFFLIKGNHSGNYYSNGLIQGKINLEEKSMDEDEKQLDERLPGLSKLKSDALIRYENEIAEIIN